MLLLSTNPRFVFVHIPKNAGTVFSQATRNDSCLDHGLAKHATLGEALDTHPEFSGAEVYAVFRNPWERLWSLYNFVLGGAFNRIEARKQGQKTKPTVTDSQDRATVAEMTRLGFSGWVVYGEPYFGHNRRCQLDFADGPNLTPIRFEHLEGEPVNTTQYVTRDYRPQYNDEAKSLVARIYARDIDRFGYSFD